MNTVLTLILGSHEHVPYGTGDDEFERIYRLRLKPFISALYKFPKVPAALHYSGVLLHWIERNHPEFFMLIEDLISRKQVELMGGGFYEPLMPFLAPPDRIAQIEMMTTYLRKQFGKRPQGCWLPGFAWEQSLVGTLNACGMSYTFLDEEQFNAAGMSAPRRPVISEEQGKLVMVFPILSRFSGTFSWKDAPSVLRRLQEEAAGELVSLFPRYFFSETESPDLEIHRFFEALSGAASFIEFTSPSRYLKNLREPEKVYFSASSAFQAESPAERDAAPPAGFLPRRFLIRYPEANGIYSKMIFTQVLIHQLRGDKSRKRAAREELLKAQGGDVFCHLGDGGIYNNALRKTAYRALLGVERITREKGVFIPSLLAFDFDLDGEEEYLFQDHNVNCYVSPRGAGIFELDYLPKSWNYLDTLARRWEPYTEKLPLEDSYRRGAFLDRIVSPDFTLRDFLEGRFAASRFCGGERYGLAALDRGRGNAQFRLSPNPAFPFGAMELEKTYHLRKDILTVDYTLTNRGGETERFALLSEIDLSFAGEGDTLQRILKLAGGTREAVSGRTELTGLEGVEFQDIKNETILTLGVDRSITAWIVPIRTRCRIHGFIADQYQSTCVAPVIPMTLEPGGKEKICFTLRITH
jgi:hypothetical protein